jgi:hypothetical protein
MFSVRDTSHKVKKEKNRPVKLYKELLNTMEFQKRILCLQAAGYRLPIIGNCEIRKLVQP